LKITLNQNLTKDLKNTISKGKGTVFVRKLFVMKILSKKKNGTN
jgi:hypothetical protein